MAEKKLNAGEIVFSEGDVADFAYIVNAGAVELVYMNNGSEARLGDVEPGKIFGELALFMSTELRPYTARALTETSVLAVRPEEFEQGLSKCPKDILPFLLAAFEKAAPSKSRTKITAAPLPRSDIAKIAIAPATDTLKSQMKSLEIPTTSLPFRIGGYPENGKKNPRDQLHLALASATDPMVISRQHCELALDEKDNLVVNDLGSRFCTMVNGTIIGRGRGIYAAPLKKGANEVCLGDESKYRLSVTCK